MLHIYIYINQNSQAVKKEIGPQKGQDEKKRSKIQGGSQEMAVMVGGGNTNTPELS